MPKINKKDLKGCCWANSGLVHLKCGRLELTFCNAMFASSVCRTSVQAYSLTTSTVASDSGYRYINCESGNPVWWWDTCYKS